MNKSRVEAFSDGVFAIAITLLVLTIAPPKDYGHLASEFAHRWPSLAAYVVSFAIIGIMWLNHHSVFSQFERIDRGVVYLNMLLLLTITFLPYPTGVLGEALAKGRGTRAAAVFYGVTMAVNALAWAGMWLYGSSKRRLLRASFPEEERALATLLFTIGVVVYLLAVGVAFWNAYVFLGVQAAIGLYYALDPVTRRPGRGRRASDAPASTAVGTGNDGARQLRLGLSLATPVLAHELSQAAARAGDARVSHASWTTSASSASVSPPIRLARMSTDGWPSKCGVVKNGESSSWTSACLSASDGTQNMITSG
jgi:uncharacterized membrane protein